MYAIYMGLTKLKDHILYIYGFKISTYIFSWQKTKTNKQTNKNVLILDTGDKITICVYAYKGIMAMYLNLNLQ